MEEFYFRIVYWDEETYRYPVLIEDDGGDVYGNFLHNCVVFAWIDHGGDLLILNELKESIKEKLKTNKNSFDLNLKLSVVNFVMNDMVGFCNNYKIKIFEYPVLSTYLIELLMLVIFNKISYSEATNKVLPHLINKCDRTPTKIVEDLGLGVTDDNLLDTVIDNVLDEYPDKLKSYLDGKKGLFGMFMGEIMKSGNGFNPKIVNKTLREKLNSLES